MLRGLGGAGRREGPLCMLVKRDLIGQLSLRAPLPTAASTSPSWASAARHITLHVSRWAPLCPVLPGQRTGVMSAHPGVLTSSWARIL